MRPCTTLGLWHRIKPPLQKLKADRPHPRDYSPTPPDHRRTDKTLGLVLHTHERTDRRTDGRYQLHYLPHFAVDKNLGTCMLGILARGIMNVMKCSYLHAQ